MRIKYPPGSQYADDISGAAARFEGLRGLLLGHVHAQAKTTLWVLAVSKRAASSSDARSEIRDRHGAIVPSFRCAHAGYELQFIADRENFPLP
jgi:hypothetical protein